ncbi:MAG: DUF2865 domain-containing protein [Nitratireductor sp.]
MRKQFANSSLQRLTHGIFGPIFALWFSVFISTIIVVSSYQDVHAQSNACVSLKRQLASLGAQRSKPSAKYNKYKRAVNDQASQIRKTKVIMRRAGCHVISGSSKCRRIKSSLSKMESNLRALQKQTRRLAPKSGNVSRQRAKIERSLRGNNCNAKQQVAEKPKRKTLLEQIFGTRTYSNDGRNNKTQGGGTIGKFGTTYRTLCVRICDGYYFPISFSTTKNRLEQDNATCQGTYKGVETALFFHKMPQEDAEQSVSYLSGQPYSSLENAFAYRKSYNPSCDVEHRYVSGLDEIAGGEKLASVEGEKPATKTLIAIPDDYEDPNIDPETLMNRRGKLSPTIIGRLATGNEGDKEYAKGNIRIVGPAFFPVQ